MCLVHNLKHHFVYSGTAVELSGFLQSGCPTTPLRTLTQDIGICVETMDPIRNKLTHVTADCIIPKSLSPTVLSTIAPSPITRTTTGQFNISQTLMNITCADYTTSSTSQDTLFGAVKNVLKSFFSSQFNINLKAQPNSCTSTSRRMLASIKAVTIHYMLIFTVTSLNITVLESTAKSIVRAINAAIESGDMTEEIATEAILLGATKMKFVISNSSVTASVVEIISQTGTTQAPVTSKSSSAQLFDSIESLEIAIIVIGSFFCCSIVRAYLYTVSE